MEHLKIYEQIKKEYCSLFSFKLHGPTLEVITPIATLTDKFISVFITIREGIYFVADGGWIADNVYDAPFAKVENAMLKLLNNQYMRYFDIAIYESPDRDPMYYKRTEKIEMIAACVFDVANFIALSVNADAVEYQEKKKTNERERFKKETGLQLKTYFGEKLSLNREIAKGLTFNCVVQKENRLHLIEFITGHTAHYFDASVKDALVNFQLLQGDEIRHRVDSRIAIFNEHSDGFNAGYQPRVVDLLHTYTTRPYITSSDLKSVVLAIEN